MTQRDRGTLKSLFETGDQPTGQNYSDLIDSFYNIIDTSVISVQHLAATTVVGTYGNFTNLNVGTLTQSGVPLISDLKALSNMDDGDYVLVKGGTAANDYGGGFYVYDADASAVDNYASVVAPDSGVGRWLRLELGARGVFDAHDYGAVGDGTTDDTAAIQAAVDAAEAVQGSKLLLLPEVSFGISDTIDLGEGPYDTVFEGASIGVSGDHWTFTKLADVAGIRVVHDANSQPTLIRVGVKGLGAANPEDTTTEDTTPGIVLHSRAILESPRVGYTGGVVGSEPGTTGYGIGMFQQNSGNTNLTRITGAVCRRIKGDGIYNGMSVDASARNCNAQIIEVANISGITGYGVNNTDGFKCRFRIDHFVEDPCTALGVFQDLYVENKGEAVYIESGADKFVVFGTTGGRNRYGGIDIEAAVSVVTPDIRNNIIEETNTGKFWVGDGTAPNDPGYYGTAGLTVDRVYIQNGAEDDYVAISAAEDTDFGTAVDILAGATGGKVNYTAREAETMRVGRLVTMAINLAGAKTSASSTNAHLKIENATTNIDIENQDNDGAIGPLLLDNDAGRKLVFLRNDGVDQYQIMNASAENMSFNDVCGASAFTLSGTISILSR